MYVDINVHSTDSSLPEWAWVDVNAFQEPILRSGRELHRQRCKNLQRHEKPGAFRKQNRFLLI
jgi:hypothetical protein